MGRSKIQSYLAKALSGPGAHLVFLSSCHRIHIPTCYKRARVLVILAPHPRSSSYSSSLLPISTSSPFRHLHREQCPLLPSSSKLPSSFTVQRISASRSAPCGLRPQARFRSQCMPRDSVAAIVCPISLHPYASISCALSPSPLLSSWLQRGVRCSPTPCLGPRSRRDNHRSGF